MSFINEFFMLKGETSKILYSMVEDLPIIDYHCHLNVRDIAENRRFKNAYEIFLSGDHYKWRQMRTNGIEEKYITGDASDREKFFAFAATLPGLIGNPVYHWTHLELKRYFGIDEILTEKSAESIWDKCNAMLRRGGFCAKELILKSSVEVICTTDDPADELVYHSSLRGFGVKVLPTFRPDRVIDIDADDFISYITENKITGYSQLIRWIYGRIDYFNLHGCRLADHSLTKVPFSLGDAKAAFEKRIAGGALSEQESDSYRTELLRICARRYSELGWAMQLHIGALRNNNRKMYETLGRDTGFDSINDLAIAEPLSRLLDSLEYEDLLPKTILYNLNPKDNYVIASMIGNFQRAPFRGKIQFGSGWWFNDQRDGMVAQHSSLANLGMLSSFVGMLTDSRSFLSYTRHEYFRRIFSSFIGGLVDSGEYPRDFDALEKIMTGICYYNAKEYFGF